MNDEMLDDDDDDDSISDMSFQSSNLSRDSTTMKLKKLEIKIRNKEKYFVDI